MEGVQTVWVRASTGVSSQVGMSDHARLRIARALQSREAAKNMRQRKEKNPEP
jgi:hypothetical protein